MSAAVLREVRLYGALGREFGRLFHLAVATPAEAVRALVAVLPGFEKAFLGRDGRQAYHVLVGRKALRRDLSKEELCEPLGATDPIRLVPVIAGAKRQGWGQIILGYVLMVAGAVVFAYGGDGSSLISLGLAMQYGGLIQLLSPQRKGKDPTTNLPSYVFDGPVNNTEQGGPVPVRYGRSICGSVVVSQGIRTTQIAVTAAPAPIYPGYTGLPGYEPVDPWGDGGH